MDQHPGRLHQAAEQPALQLELCDRAGGQRQGPLDPDPARQDTRRIELDQRHAVCPRQSARLQHLGAVRQPRLVIRVGAALFPQVRAFRAGRRRDARPRRPAERRQHDRTCRTAGCVHRCGRGRGLSAQSGLQQRQPGRLRLFPGDAEEGPALVHRACLPRSRAWPPEPAHRDRGLHDAHPAGRQARRRRRVSSARPDAAGAVRRRGDPCGGRGQVAAYAGAVGHRPAGAAAITRHRGEARAARRRRELSRPLRPAHELAGEAAGHAERANARRRASPRRSSNTTRSSAAC